MEPAQQFSLRWTNYLRHVTNVFDNLRNSEDLVDVTLYCEGKKIKAHKMLLSACSSYFRDIFKENPCQHPVIIFRNVKFDDLISIINFMYHGEVSIAQEQLASFLTTAELLEVEGLTDDSDSKDEEKVKEYSNEIQTQATEDSTSSASKSKKRKMNVGEEQSWNNDERYSDLEYIDPDCNLKLEHIEVSDSKIKTDKHNIDLDENIILESDDVDICEPQCSNATEFKIINADQSTVEDSMQTISSGLSLKDTSQGMPLKSSSYKNNIRVLNVNDNKAYKCEKCSKSFKHPLSLSQHLKIHSGETKCAICLKILSRVHDLRLHQATVHGLKK